MLLTFNWCVNLRRPCGGKCYGKKETVRITAQDGDTQGQKPRMVYTVWKQNKNKRNPHFSMINKTSGREKQQKKKKAFAHVQYLHSLVRNLCTGPTKVSKSIKIAVKIHTHKSTPYKKARELSHRLARFGM